MTTKQKQLSQKAMLIHFQISAWTGRVKDQRVSEEIIQSKHAEKDSGAWWTYLIPKTILRDIHRTYMRCRNVHYKLTLPWQDGGCRILPSAMFMDYTKAMREVTAEYDEAVKNFLNVYPKIAAEAPERLGKLNNKKLPNISQIKNKFGYHQSIYPLPDVNDFRVDMAEEDVKDIRKQVEASIKATTEKAMTSIWSRLAELIDKIEQTLKEPKKIFRDTLISNLSEFCELIPKLNLTDDSKLEFIRKETIDRLADLSPDNLREDKKERKAASKTAKEMLEKMKAYSGI